MADKKATRQGYGAGLAELAKKYDNVVALDADLCGSVGTKEFAKNFPERHTNAGIAEANMLGMAAGMARVGLVPFAASFAVFCPGRAFEIVRNGICYSNVNVKLCGSHSGLTSAADGGTHQAIEDIAIMRSLPNMTVFSQTYYGDFDKTTAAPIAMPVLSTVEGFMTAVQYMVKGDDWLVYIPQQLAYKDLASDAIPAYSTLLYHLRIELVHKSGTGMSEWR